MTKAEEKCPYAVGEAVIYEPSAKGLAYYPLDKALTPGTEYVVQAVLDEVYILVEGYNPPGGGIYWTEFKALPTAHGST